MPDFVTFFGSNDWFQIAYRIFSVYQKYKDYTFGYDDLAV